MSTMDVLRKHAHERVSFGVRSGKTLLPVDIEFMDPSVATWDDTNVMPEKQVVLNDQNTRIRVRIPNMFSSLSQMTAVPELSTLKIKTALTNPGGVDYPLTSGSCTFAVVTDTNGQTYDEVRVTLSYQQLNSLGLLTTNPPTAKAWLDDGENDSSQDHNLDDGEAFDAGMTVQTRGQSTKFGNLSSTPPNSPGFDNSFVKAGGAEIITAEFGGASSPKRQVINQANFLYLSVEGYSSNGSIVAYNVPQKSTMSVVPEDIKDYWKQRLDTVIIAGCAVLDINDYNNNYPTVSPPASPGKRWAATGVDTMLGYNFYAPLDTHGSVPIIKEWISLTTTTEATAEYAWGIANKDNKAWNACAIVASDGYYYFSTTTLFGHVINYTWNKVPEPANGW
jgi:hypothetical protein